MAIAYQLGLRKSRQVREATRRHYILVLVIMAWALVRYPCFFNFDHLELGSILNHIIFNNVPASVAALKQQEVFLLIEFNRLLQVKWSSRSLWVGCGSAICKIIGSFAKFAVVVCAALLGWQRKKSIKNIALVTKLNVCCFNPVFWCCNFNHYRHWMFGEAMHFFHFVSPIDF